MKFLKKQENGFTLIEISIVLMIIGIVMTGFMNVLYINMQKNALKTTRENIDTVRKSLQSYYVINRHFPCPASSTAKAGSPDFGKAREVCLDENLNPITAAAEKNHITTAYSPAEKQVSIGMVPFRSLGIPDSVAKDGWGNFLQLSMTSILTDARLFSQMEGAIDITAEDGQSRLSPEFSAQYVIFSTGKNGVGGYSGDMAKVSDCPEGTLESQNCNGDAIFMDTQRNTVAPDNPYSFDDLLFYQQYDPNLESNGGLIVKYKTECMKDFAKIDFENEKTIGLEILAKDLQTLNKKTEKDDFVLCYSSKYSVKLINAMELNSQQSECPDQWTFIGYKYFQSSEYARSSKRKVYAACAR